MNFRVLECTTQYGGLDCNLSLHYILLEDYSVYNLIMTLDSVQQDIIENTTNPNDLISGLVTKFHKYSKKIYLDDMSDEMVTKLREYKLYELLK